MDLEYLDPTVANSPIVGGAGVGPTAAIIAPGYVTQPWAGRNAYRIQIQYISGFPHAGITVAATQGGSSLTVDDVTGLGLASTSDTIGATIYDGASTEVIQITGCTPTNGSTGVGSYGPGTVSLSGTLLFAHSGPNTEGLPQVMVSTMPLTIQQAAIELATSFALMRGSTATTVPRQPGNIQQTGGAAADLENKAYRRLDRFKRVF